MEDKDNDYSLSLYIYIYDNVYITSKSDSNKYPTEPYFAATDLRIRFGGDLVKPDPNLRSNNALLSK